MYCTGQKQGYAWDDYPARAAEQGFILQRVLSFFSVNIANISDTLCPMMLILGHNIKSGERALLT